MKNIKISKSGFIKCAVIIVPLITCSSAFAATTPTAFDYVQIVIDACVQLGVDVNKMLAGAWPVIIAVTIAFLGIPIFKKIAHKIAS